MALPPPTASSWEHSPACTWSTLMDKMDSPACPSMCCSGSTHQTWVQHLVPSCLSHEFVSPCKGASLSDLGPGLSPWSRCAKT